MPTDEEGMGWDIDNIPVSVVGRPVRSPRAERPHSEEKDEGKKRE